MIDADDEIAKCRAALDRARSRFSWWDRLTYLRVAQPSWAARDALAVFFTHRAALLATGRVTWGHTVQANSALFELGPHDLPGEVVYVADPQVPVDVQALGQVADQLYQLKGTRQIDPVFSELSTYLADEYIRVFGAKVPALISAGMPCAISTVFFSRKHLPNRVLSRRLYPIIVSDAEPRVAMVLQSRFWSEALQRHWVSPGDP
jgi:hypothetical protein